MKDRLQKIRNEAIAQIKAAGGEKLPVLPEVSGDDAASGGQTVDRHVLLCQRRGLGQKLQPGHVQLGTAAEKQQADGPRGAAQVDALCRGGSIHKIRQQHAVGA